MTIKEILDLPIGKHLAKDRIGQAYSIDVISEEYIFVIFGAQYIGVSTSGSVSLIVGDVYISSELTDRIFERLTLLK